MTADPLCHISLMVVLHRIDLDLDHFILLYYTILYYTILYYTILYYTILYYTILYYTILYYTILYYTILYYTIPYYSHQHLHCNAYRSLWLYSTLIQKYLSIVTKVELLVATKKVLREVTLKRKAAKQNFGDI